MEGQRILVTTDLSDNARPAARTAHQLAKRLDKQLELMHVFDLSQRGAGKNMEVFRDPALRERAEQRLNQWFQESAGVVPDHVTLEAGEPAAEIRNRASTSEIGGLVLSMSGRGAWSKLVFGSTALKIAGRPPCPTAVVHPEFHRVADGMTIGVGTDFTRTSDAALRRAVWLANRFQSSIRIVHATALPATTVIHEGELPAGMERTEVVEWARESMDAFVERHRELLADVDYRARVVTDHPVAGLRSFVEDRGIDWLVLGDRRPEQRRGASTVKGKWVQQMNCSTLLVPS